MRCTPRTRSTMRRRDLLLAVHLALRASLGFRLFDLALLAGELDGARSRRARRPPRRSHRSRRVGAARRPRRAPGPPLAARRGSTSCRPLERDSRPPACPRAGRPLHPQIPLPTALPRARPATASKDSVALKREWIDAWRAGLAKGGLDLPIARVGHPFPYYGDTCTNWCAACPRPRGGGRDARVHRGAAARAFMHADPRRGPGEGRGPDALVEGGARPRRRRARRPLRLGAAVLSAIDRHVAARAAARASTVVHERRLPLPAQPWRRGAASRLGCAPRSARRRDGRRRPLARQCRRVQPAAARRRQPGWKVPTSRPLGRLAARRDMIRRASRRRSTRRASARWFNAFDPADVVALHRLDREHFGSGRRREPPSVHNHTETATGSPSLPRRPRRRAPHPRRPSSPIRRGAQRVAHSSATTAGPRARSRSPRRARPPSNARPSRSRLAQDRDRAVDVGAVPRTPAARSIVFVCACTWPYSLSLASARPPTAATSGRARAGRAVALAVVRQLQPSTSSRRTSVVASNHAVASALPRRLRATSRRSVGGDELHPGTTGRSCPPRGAGRST